MNEVKFIVSYEIPINAWKQLTICVQQKTNIWYAKENKNRYGRLQVTICKAITKVGNRGIRESGNWGIGEYGNGRRYRYAVSTTTIYKSIPKKSRESPMGSSQNTRSKVQFLKNY